MSIRTMSKAIRSSHRRPVGAALLLALVAGTLFGTLADTDRANAQPPSVAKYAVRYWVGAVPDSNTGENCSLVPPEQMQTNKVGYRDENGGDDGWKIHLTAKYNYVDKELKEHVALATATIKPDGTVDQALFGLRVDPVTHYKRMDSAGCSYCDVPYLYNGYHVTYQADTSVNIGGHTYYLEQTDQGLYRTRSDAEAVPLYTFKFQYWNECWRMDWCPLGIRQHTVDSPGLFPTYVDLKFQYVRDQLWCRQGQ
jgi:hypothetical protein